MFQLRRNEKMTNVNQAWNALRANLKNFVFYDIKEIVGLAGFDITQVSHLEQKPGGGASKGQLITGIDKGFMDFDENEKKRFIAIVAEEMLKRKPDMRESLQKYLSRLGWTLSGTAVIPIEILDISALEEIPSESKEDLIKAGQRLRDGDLSGAISSICGALDTATEKVYASENLGDPAQAAFQERCKKALAAKSVIPTMEQQLNALGWKANDIKSFFNNYKGSLNQGAYVIQVLRSKMGDVHGTKPVLKTLVFDCLKWAELMLHTLKDD